MIDLPGIFNEVLSHALASGQFEAVNGHEPKSAPRTDGGLVASLWVQRVGPVSEGSGLQATTGLLVLNLRIYKNMISEPQDDIDIDVLAAVDAMLGAYSGDFELGGRIRQVDLLGQTREPLSAEAGYLEIDKRMFRIMTITLPLIINDLWEQVA
jgi:hypothetical protein